MVKLHKAQTTYAHPFPAVSLAYFLRYPNPYSTHVLSTDTISRHVDPVTGRLHTVRLHLKQSKVPPVIAKLLPTSLVSGSQGADGQSRNLILETSVVDPREGWMETETRNLQYTGVLTVTEQQRFSRSPASTDTAASAALPAPIGPDAAFAAPSADPARPFLDLRAATKGESTDVSTTVTFVSRFGQAARAAKTNAAEDEAPRRSFLQSWSSAALQRTIEASGLQRTRNALVKSREGMLVVLDRIRHGGVVGALEGMRRDRDLVLAGATPQRLQAASLQESQGYQDVE